MRRPFILASSLFSLSTVAFGFILLFLPFAKVSAVPRAQDTTAQPTDAASVGCISCHGPTDSPTMHQTATVKIGCADCHGGDPSVSTPPGATKDQAAYSQAKLRAHVQPREPKDSHEVERRAYTKWLQESAEYVRFINPGDLRVAEKSCGNSGCHISEVQRTRSSLMTHGAMLWEAALYNNGAYPFKNPHFGESYSKTGAPQRLQTWPPPSPEETRRKGILPFLEPLPRWETSQPGNVLRVFERGGEKRGEVGNPVSEEAPGRPDAKLSDRGFGTLLRTDPVFLGLQKTRLLDPLLYMPGTNDQPGDYRGSGCTGCHVLYANDRDPAHSGPIAQYGNEGKTQTSDATIPKDESGHPLKHVFTRSIPSSQCMVCHVHPGTNMVTTYFGYTWWDNEADANKMYPPKSKELSAAERREIQDRQPEAGGREGLWSDLEFLKKVGTAEFNAQLKQTQFADFHSHGWIFRAVFKRDRKGNLLDEDGTVISPEDPERFKKAVHLKDIHLEKGMHCIDCHFEQ